MQYWEFLLQKEGDHSWQNINQHSLELPEGKYRIVAHTDCTNIDVEIRVTHQTNTPEGKNLRRSQKRSRHTNAEGLIVIIPFTDLKSGLWEFRCYGDLMSDLMGQPWQKILRLQILPKNPYHLIPENITELERTTKTLNNQESIDPETIITETILSVTNISQNKDEQNINEDTDDCNHDSQNQPEITTVNFEPQSQENHLVPGVNLLEKSLQELESLLQAEVSPILEDIDELETKPQPELVIPSETESPEVQISLEQATYVWHRGKAITISGRIENTEFGNLETLNQVKLGYELRDPQNGKIILNFSYNLPEITLPFAFEHQLGIPQDYNTHLILGEISLATEQQINSEKATIQILTFTPFTITADVNELLNLVHSQESNLEEKKKKPEEIVTVIQPEETENLIEEVVKSSDLVVREKEPELKHLELFHPTSPENMPNSFAPATGFVIPPRLNRSSSREKPKFPQLPEFVKQPLPTLEPIIDITEAEIPVEVDSDLEGENLVEQMTDSVSVATETEVKELVEVTDFAAETELGEAFNQTEATEIHLENTAEIKPDKLEEPRETANILAEENLETTVRENELEELETSNNEFQSLHLGNRFWSRLNSLIGKNQDLIETEITTQTEPESELESELESEPETESKPELESEPKSEFVSNSEISDLESLESMLAEAALALDIEADESQQLKSLLDEATSDLKLETETNTSAANISEITNFDDEWHEIIDSFNQQEESILLPAIEASIEFEESEIELDEFERGITDLIPETESELPIIATETEAISTDLSSETASVTEVTEATKAETLLAAEWDSLEIVVEDDELTPIITPKYDTSGLPYPEKVAPPRRKSPLIASESLELPVPAPILSINKQELTPGESLVVQVKLPPYSGSPYIKLWVQDPQTRSLLDGPRALVDLEPNRAGELETMTQITVPYGSMEIRFEAIAIDPDTQQESHKVSIDRVVIPEGLAEFELDRD